MPSCSATLADTLEAGPGFADAINIHLEHHEPPQRHHRYGGALGVAIAVSAGMMVVEAYVAWLTGSLALLSDAGHMLADLLGLLLAYAALRVASRPATHRASYGFARYEVLAAGANGFLLMALVLGLAWRALARLRSPVAELDTPVILAVAALGLAVNILAAWLLHRGAGENINARAALWNVLGDGLASLGVLVAIGIVHMTGDTRWDTYVTFAVAAIIFVAAARLLRQSASILLEAAPPGIDLAEMKEHVEALPGVVNVHDLHCWTLTPGNHSLTMHVTIDRSRLPRFHHVVHDIEHLLATRWGLRHCTIQAEPAGEDPVSDQHNPVPRE